MSHVGKSAVFGGFVIAFATGCAQVLGIEAVEKQTPNIDAGVDLSCVDELVAASEL